MSITPAELREDIDDYLLAQLGPASATDPPWHRSRYAYPTFPALDADDVLSRSYAVGVLPGGDFPEVPQRPNGPGPVVLTRIGVRYLRRLRPDAHAADYAAALADEATFIDTVLDTQTPFISAMRVADVTQRDIVGNNDWYVGGLVFEVRHFYALP